MPPRNAARSLFSEDGLAQRIGYERERRGWTYEGLAKRMTDAGCPINQSAIYKIEKGTKKKGGAVGPPRRITVDELVALAAVFELPLQQLLLPPALAATTRAAELLIAWDEAQQEEARARAGLETAWQQLREHVAQNPDVGSSLEKLLRVWSEQRYSPDYEGRDEAAAYWLSKITGRPEDEQRWEQVAGLPSKEEANERLQKAVREAQTAQFEEVRAKVRAKLEQALGALEVPAERPEPDSEARG